jgi:hypothetical protein
LSVRLKVFRHEKPRICTGVSKRIDVLRLLRSSGMLSIVPPGPGIYRNAKSPTRSMCRFSVFVMVNDGVHVSHSPARIGLDVIERDGNVRSSASRPGYCCCVPPSDRENGPRPVVKLSCDEIVCTATNGLNVVLRWTVVFVT